MNKKSEFKLIAQPGVCQFCMKSFATNTSLRRHIKSVHNGIKDVIKRKNYKCNLCEFTTRCQSYLDDHLISKLKLLILKYCTLMYVYKICTYLYTITK